MNSDQNVERSVLGLMLLDGEAFTEASELDSDDFYLPSHRVIFNRLVTMDGDGLEIDQVTLVAELVHCGEMDAVGGPGYVADLTTLVPPNSKLKTYLKLLRRHAVARKAIALCDAARGRLEDGGDPGEVLTDLQGTALDALMRGIEVRPVHISEWVQPTLDELVEERNTPSGQLLGVPTGVEELDQVTTGYRKAN